jgi:SAM-dependent methyltransferase
LQGILQRAFYRYGFDTRCRNLGPARALRPLMEAEAPSGRPVLLDVGCGQLGLAGFMPDVAVVGVDIEPPPESAPNLTFHRGSVTNLPFPDQSFPFVSCIDVLEHLPLDARARAVRELVRVAARALLVAHPHGPTARRCDEDFRRAMEERGQAAPAWVYEHLGQTYPTAAEIAGQVRAAAAAAGRAVKISLSYSEPLTACRLVRATAARSGLLYAAVNLALGAVSGVLPAPGADDSYRVIVLAEFTPAADGATPPAG